MTDINPTERPTEANPFTQGVTLWREHEAFINKKAQSIARSFWKVEEEDVKQEIWIFLWEKEEFFREGGYGDSYVRVSIHNVATNYALRQRSKTLLETDTFYYASDEVKELLPAFLSSYESWALSPVPPGYATATKNDNVEVFCDFALAWNRLNDTQKDVLERKYSDDDDFTDAKDRQALSRATRRFVELLNQTKDKQSKAHTGPGSRKAMTAAQGQYEARKVVD